MAEKKNILAISAHPSDFCSRCGGTLIRHVKAGYRVGVIWLSHGETQESRDLRESRPELTLEEVKAIREKEAFAAAEVMGVEGVMLGFGDGPLIISPERLEILAAEVEKFKPDTILTHYLDERPHYAHRITGEAAVDVAQRTRVCGDIRYFEPTLACASRIGYVPDHYVNITEEFDQKMEALGKLAAQPKLPEVYAICSRWRGLESGCEHAEAFVRHMPTAPLVDTMI